MLPRHPPFSEPRHLSRAKPLSTGLQLPPDCNPVRNPVLLRPRITGQRLELPESHLVQCHQVSNFPTHRLLDVNLVKYITYPHHSQDPLYHTVTNHLNPKKTLFTGRTI